MKDTSINLSVFWVFAILIVGVITPSWAQDYHLSQFDEVQMMLNPAHTGMTKNIDFRASSVYRSQWRPLISRPYSTFALAYDMEVAKRWGVGAYLVNTNGAKIFNSFNIVVSGAYEITKPDQDEHEFTVGLQVGFIYRNTNDRDLTFNNQYSSGEFDIGLPSLEAFNQFAKFMPELSMGTAYKYTKEESFARPYVGFSLWHITSPKVAYIEGTEEESRLPRRVVFNAGSELQATDNLLFDLKLLTMFQGQAKEILFGFETAYLVNEDNDVQVSLGTYYRMNDAVIIATGINYLNLRFNMSFDIVTSELKNYTSGSALEFTFTYVPKTSRYRLKKS